jgi:hypothetical protein
MLDGPPPAPDSDADLLALRLRVQQSEITGKGLKTTLDKRSTKKPEQIARALASVAQGLAARRDSAGALRLLREQKRVSLRDPEAAPALRAFVAIARESGRRARRCRSRARGRRASRTPRCARAARARARGERCAARAGARGLRARARARREERRCAARPRPARARRDPSQALALFDRAAADRTSRGRAVLGGARALVTAGRAADAEARLAPRCPSTRSWPRSPGARELRAARSEFSDETLALARRAVRLGGSPERGSGSRACTRVAAMPRRPPRRARSAREEAPRPGA